MGKRQPVERALYRCWQESLRLLLFQVLARFLRPLSGKWLLAREVLLKVSTGHHTGRNLQANPALRGIDGHRLQIGQEGMLLFRGAQVPRAGVRVPSAMTLHRSGAGHLTYARHGSSLSFYAGEKLLITTAFPEIAITSECAEIYPFAPGSVKAQGVQGR